MKHRPHLAARSALAVAACIALTGWPQAASALGLGRLSVQSALGEGMRAEIDITNLSPEEAASLAVRVASPDAYRAAGVEYNSVLAGTQVSVARRADGRPYLRVVSDRAMQEPFLEVILEMTWSSGRLVREYTLLFDPPNNRNAPPVQAGAPAAPVIAAAPPAAEAAPAAPAAKPAPAGRNRAAAPAARASAPAPAPVAAAPAAEAPAPARDAVKPAEAAGADRYTVRRGDTLTGIANRNLESGVSLDQMLVGLYRANPDAFIKGNMNRLKAGSVLAVPGAETARAVDAEEARRVIVAQSQDFGAYRGRLAQSAPAAETETAGRQAKGSVQAEVDDRKQSAAPTSDRLKLSGAAPKASSPEAQVAQANERKDAAARVAELSRNVEELKKIQQGSGPGAAASAAGKVAAAPAPSPAPAPATPVAAAPASAVAPLLPASAAPAVPLTPPVVPPVATAPMPAASAELPAAVPAPMAAASKPAAPALPPLPTPESEPSFLDSLTSSPYLLPGAGILAVLLAGFGAWRLRNRMQKSPGETSFLESRMQPDSFFGASGGQRVDTRDATGSGAGSSMGYSLSQIDAIGDVDPVAEADVYLAYGRDLQAEEILKEAMRATPDRLAVRTKLLEVYAKRRDTKGFELLATQLFALTGGAGSDWTKAQDLGRQIDPDNPLYQPGGHPDEVVLDGERVVVEPLSAATMPHQMGAGPASTLAADLGRAGGPPSESMDLDLDLSDQDAARGLEATQPLSPTGRPAMGAGPAAAKADERTVRAELGTVSLDLDDLDDLPAAPARPAAATAAPRRDAFAPSESGPLSRTPSSVLDSLSADDSDPLARKLELAEEFRQIGDVEGARDLVNEVLVKAEGALKARAQAMLDALS